jgi:hypothetical protein
MSHTGTIKSGKKVVKTRCNLMRLRPSDYIPINLFPSTYDDDDDDNGDFAAVVLF